MVYFTFCCWSRGYKTWTSANIILFVEKGPWANCNYYVTGKVASVQPRSAHQEATLPIPYIASTQHFPLFAALQVLLPYFPIFPLVPWNLRFSVSFHLSFYLSTLSLFYNNVSPRCQIRSSATHFFCFSTSCKGNSATYAFLTESIMCWAHWSGHDTLRTTMQKNSLGWCSKKHQDTSRQYPFFDLVVAMMPSFARLEDSRLLKC